MKCPGKDWMDCQELQEGIEKKSTSGKEGGREAKRLRKMTGDTGRSKIQNRDIWKPSRKGRAGEVKRNTDERG